MKNGTYILIDKKPYEVECYRDDILDEEKSEKLTEMARHPISSLRDLVRYAKEEYQDAVCVVSIIHDFGYPVDSSSECLEGFESISKC